VGNTTRVLRDIVVMGRTLLDARRQLAHRGVDRKTKAWSYHAPLPEGLVSRAQHESLPVINDH
jgi:hypothetical protein